MPKGLREGLRQLARLSGGEVGGEEEPGALAIQERGERQAAAIRGEGCPLWLAPAELRRVDHAHGATACVANDVELAVLLWTGETQVDQVTGLHAERERGRRR